MKSSICSRKALRGFFYYLAAMNKLVTAVVVSLLLFTTGCANDSSPEKVLRSFLKKMEDKDYDAAAKLVTQNSQSTINEMKTKAAGQKNAQIPEETIYANKKMEINFEIGTTKITGNLATVMVNHSDNIGGEPRQYSAKWALEKEEGKWKVMMVPAPQIQIR
jgi:limonene-1,2-epoxide hydrolase